MTLSRSRPSGAVRVEREGALVIATLRGTPTADLLLRCHEQVLALARADGRGKVLYDVMEMVAPDVDVPWAQRELDASLGMIHLKRAILVPNSKLAYLARLAFGAGDYRVFYDDRPAALRWLTGTLPQSSR